MRWAAALQTDIPGDGVIVELTETELIRRLASPPHYYTRLRVKVIRSMHERRSLKGREGGHVPSTFWPRGPQASWLRQTKSSLKDMVMTGPASDYGEWSNGGRRNSVARWTRRRAAPADAPIPTLTWLKNISIPFRIRVPYLKKLNVRPPYVGSDRCLWVKFLKTIPAKN